MDNVVNFRPRPRPAAAAPTISLSQASIRAQLEEAAQVALNTADRIIAVLDHLDGDADLEDGGDVEPSLAAPENHTGSQVVWMRGGDRDCEAETPEGPLPEVANEDRPEPSPLPWGGRGNVVAAAGVALLTLVGA